MSLSYLKWLDDLFEEAQVTYNEDQAPYIDQVIRRIADAGPDVPGEQILQILQRKWLKQGYSGRQLLASLLRNEVFSRRDSPLRPKEGVGYFTN